MNCLYLQSAYSSIPVQTQFSNRIPTNSHFYSSLLESGLCKQGPHDSARHCASFSSKREIGFQAKDLLTNRSSANCQGQSRDHQQSLDAIDMARASSYMKRILRHRARIFLVCGAIRSLCTSCRPGLARYGAHVRAIVPRSRTLTSYRAIFRVIVCGVSQVHVRPLTARPQYQI